MRFNSKKYPLLTSENWFNYTMPDEIFPDLKNHTRMDFELKFRKMLDSVLDILFRRSGTKFGYVSQKFFDDAIFNQEKTLDFEFDEEIKYTHYKLIIEGQLFIGYYPVWGALFEGNQLLSFCQKVEGSKCSYMEITIPTNNNKPAWEWCILIPRIILLFKKYAPHKTKILPPKGKIKEFHCRYKSDLNIELDLFTENWYTESLQLHEYKVRKHLRWQRVGVGRKKRRLTWVKPHIRRKYKKGAYMDLE